MRRIHLIEFGPPDVLRLEEVSDPHPGPGQVLIDVAYAGVTFVETQVRAGTPPWAGSLPPTPYTPGNGVEGRVVGVGDGVPATLLHERVVTATGGSGGYADRVVVDVRMIISIPESLPPGHAVALLADGRTALALFRAGHVRADDVVLVTAAAGGVGGLLTQLAVRAGAKAVIALAGSNHKCAQARSLGADVTIDYRTSEWAAQLTKAIRQHGLHVSFDGVGGLVGRAVFDSAPPLSRYCAFGMASGTYTDASVRDIVLRGITVVGGMQLRSAEENLALSTAALDKATAGQLTPTIGRVFPLERAADAHAAIESRAVIGKTLLVC